MGKQKQSTKQRLTLGMASLGVVGLVLTALACPTTNQTYAEEMTTTEDTSIRTWVAVRPVLSISLSSLVTMDVVPTSGGSYTSGVADLKVSTNSRNGFAVLMNGVNGTDLTSMRDEQSKIASISNPSALANFPANTWGYYIGEQEPTASSQFNAIPAVSTEIKSTETSSDNQTYKVAFGTKVDANLAAGLYANEVIISVVANPNEVMGLQDLTYMQDMTPEVCAATTSLGETKELIDFRDNKTYKVAKLSDGNCWMLENLSLTLSNTRTLTPNDTDIPNDWVPTANVTGVKYMTYTASLILAGTQGTATTNGAEYAGSICPRGWKLPLSGSDSYYQNGSTKNEMVQSSSIAGDKMFDASFPIQQLYYITRNARDSGNFYGDEIWPTKYHLWAQVYPLSKAVAVRCVTISPTE